jgi:hypothetical protein
MLHKLFLEHPEAVGETYRVHQRQAFSFGSAMLLGAIACFMHGLVPAWFRCTASTTIARLHERMRTRGTTPASPVVPHAIEARTA